MKENPYAGLDPARQSAGGLGPVLPARAAAGWSDQAAYWNQRSAQPAPPAWPPADWRTGAPAGRHIYCTTCGAKLQLKVRHVGYDATTGNSVGESWLQCPRRRWWHSWKRHPKREC